MVIRRGDTEHVVITGGPTDVVIETILDHNGRETCESDRRQRVRAERGACPADTCLS
jgi:hypothetical protein